MINSLNTHLYFCAQKHILKTDSANARETFTPLYLEIASLIEQIDSDEADLTVNYVSQTPADWQDHPLQLLVSYLEPKNNRYGKEQTIFTQATLVKPFRAKLIKKLTDNIQAFLNPRGYAASDNEIPTFSTNEIISGHSPLLL